MEKEWVNYWRALKEAEKEKQEELETEKEKDELAKEIYIELTDNTK